MRFKDHIIITMLISILGFGAIGWSMAQSDEASEEEVLALLSRTGLTILPIELVTGDEPIFIDRLTSESAQVRFVSGLPVNCLIVYGETTKFGQVAQDADMGSSAVHDDHSPVLSGLKPDTQYFYRAQGSDAAGNIYVSEIFTFRTPLPSDETSDNLLHPSNGGRVIDVSSNWGDQPNEGSTWGAANAFDDNPNTAWSSNGDGDDAFVEVALAQRAHITQISFWTRTMSNDTAQIFSFMVTTDSGDSYGPFELPDPDQAYEFEVDFEASTLRFDIVESNGGNTGAVDIAVFGTLLE